MNIEEKWKELESDQDDHLSRMLNMPDIKKSLSRNPLAILKKNLVINATWGVLTGLVYIIVLIRFPFWQLFLCFGIVLIFTAWTIIKVIALYRKITTSIAGKSMLEEMERHYYSIREWIRIQEKTWLFMYPATITGGCLLGGILGSGKPAGEVIQNPVLIITTLVALVICIPVCFYLARFMNRKSFGKYVTQLGQDIDALKRENGA